MTPKMLAKLEHLRWAVNSRAKNQQCAIRLLILFREHEARWKTKKWSGAAQDLLSVSFSLWRSAFLADKTGQRSEVFDDATEFLENIIEDNAISYPQDKRSKEWTFNYYTRNARAALENLHRFWPELAPKYEGGPRTALKRWEYCQELLLSAVSGFEVRAAEEDARDGAAQKVKDGRKAAKEKRRKSRAVTLAQRSA
jgi:hypothetical protein